MNSLTVFAIIQYGREYTYLEPVFAIIPFSMQWRCLLLAGEVALLDRVDKEELLVAKMLIYVCEKLAKITKNEIKKFSVIESARIRNP